MWNGDGDAKKNCQKQKEMNERNNELLSQNEENAKWMI